MEMEHINENTIKVVIDKTDLEKRGITFLDLLGNQKHVEDFFHSILEEVGAKDKFHGTDAVTFQVVPKQDGIDLYITKGLVEGMKDMIANVIPENTGLKTPLDQVIQTIEKEISKTKKMSSKTEHKEDEPFKDTFDENQLIQQIFKFCTIHQFVIFSKLHAQYDFGLNDLYYYEQSYYFTCKLNRSQGMNQQLALQEHAEKVRMSLTYLKEHGTLIVQDNAIQTIKKQF